MTITLEPPNGCLGCNREKMEAYLKFQGMDLGRFTEVPRPRHKWGDIVCCPECGRAWLMTPASLKGPTMEPSGITKEQLDRVTEIIRERDALLLQIEDYRRVLNAIACASPDLEHYKPPDTPFSTVTAIARMVLDKYAEKRICEACGGNGTWTTYVTPGNDIAQTCRKCNGSGEVRS